MKKVKRTVCNYFLHSSSILIKLTFYPILPYPSILHGAGNVNRKGWESSLSKEFFYFIRIVANNCIHPSPQTLPSLFLGIDGPYMNL